MDSDCIVIGGGPAGLVAAVYLARFRREVTVLDAGGGRASLIPRSHNYPGFPEGVTGDELLQRLRMQATRYGARIEQGCVDAVTRRDDGGFDVRCGERVARARTIIVACGVLDIEPALPNLEHAIRRGLVRHCPICDGWEIIDQRTGVIGHGAKALREALFIRRYTPELTVFTLGHAFDVTSEQRRELEDLGVEIVETPVREVYLESNSLVGLQTDDGRDHRFQTLYSALGCTARLEFASSLAIECGPEGLVATDRHQRTSVPRVYACGDVVRETLNQIAVGAGHAAIAAATIHNELGHGPD